MTVLQDAWGASMCLFISQYLLSACEESGIVLGTVGDDKKNKDNLCPSDT